MLKVEKKNGGEALINPTHIAYIETKGDRRLQVVLDCPDPDQPFGSSKSFTVRVGARSSKSVLAEWGKQIELWMSQHQI